MTLAIILAAIACLLSMTTLYVRSEGRIQSVTANGLWTLASVISVAAFAVAGMYAYEFINAAIAGWCAYDWWNSGGGGGTRRRFTSWARRFRAVRRTAPSNP
jgi:hypothetical protein